GGRPLIYSVFRTLVDRGDRVIYPVPSWNNNHYTHLNGGDHVVVETKAENNFMPTADAIKPHVPGATMLCLCSPQNPSGTTISRKDLSAICELVLEENARRGPDQKKLYILYDQMYWQLTFGNIFHYDPVSLYPEMRAYTVYIDAISKVFAATGVRIGWAMGPAEIMKKMNAIMSHIGSWAPMAEQKATAKFLLQTEAIDTYLKQFRAALWDRLHRIYDGILTLKKTGHPVDVLAPEGGIYLTVKMDLAGKKAAGGAVIRDQQEVTSFLLNEAGLAMVPFSAFGAAKDSPWYRLSVGTCKLEDIPEMFRKLKGALEKLG
ncbi:MAG TPA: aminotransferase class I/II-fold pyridoxal phosphate-dependent enzyme, partial [Puia sp.]|nr:aminotransferase class I/II-fold pyridoxal phosphate-dependent enzyme [Puia sp.]